MTESLFENQSDKDKTLELVDNSYVKTLVGDDRKYKDTEALAKSVVDKDAHIAKIEAENAQMRQHMEKSETIEELLAKQAEMFKTEGTQSTSTEETSSEGTTQGTPPAIKPEDINKLVAQEIERRTAEQTMNNNLAKFKSDMAETFGNEVGQVWDKVRTSSGLSETDLQQLAAKSPAAVINLAKSVHTPTATKGDTNLFGSTLDASKVSAQQSVQSSDHKSNSYWKQLKKDQRGVLNGEQNRQRMEARMALGDKFWD